MARSELLVLMSSSVKMVPMTCYVSAQTTLPFEGVMFQIFFVRLMAPDDAIMLIDASIQVKSCTIDSTTNKK
jgi:hypothetical protein